MHWCCFVWMPTASLSGRRTPRLGPVRVGVCVLFLAGSRGPASRARFGAPHLSSDRFVLLLCSAPSRLRSFSSCCVFLFACFRFLSFCCSHPRCFRVFCALWLWVPLALALCIFPCPPHRSCPPPPPLFLFFLFFLPIFFRLHFVGVPFFLGGGAAAPGLCGALPARLRCCVPSCSFWWRVFPCCCASSVGGGAAPPVAVDLVASARTLLVCLGGRGPAAWCLCGALHAHPAAFGAVLFLLMACVPLSLRVFCWWLYCPPPPSPPPPSPWWLPPALFWFAFWGGGCCPVPVRCPACTAFGVMCRAVRFGGTCSLVVACVVLLALLSPPGCRLGGFHLRFVALLLVGGGGFPRACALPCLLALRCCVPCCFICWRVFPSCCASSVGGGAPPCGCPLGGFRLRLVGFGLGGGGCCLVPVRYPACQPCDVWCCSVPFGGVCSLFVARPVLVVIPPKPSPWWLPPALFWFALWGGGAVPPCMFDALPAGPSVICAVLFVLVARVPLLLRVLCCWW